MCVYIPAILLSERACLISMCEEFVSSYELYILRYELTNKLQSRKINHGKYDNMQDS